MTITDLFEISEIKTSAVVVVVGLLVWAGVRLCRDAGDGESW